MKFLSCRLSGNIPSVIDLLNNTAKEGAIHLDESLKNLVGIFPDLLFFNLAIASTMSLDVIRLNLNERSILDAFVK